MSFLSKTKTGMPVFVKEYPAEQKLIEKLIYDDLLELLVGSKAILAGGAITSIFSGAKINDFDLYFKDRQSLDTVRNYLEDKNNGYKKVYASESADTYEAGGMHFQLIKKEELITDSPDHLFNRFDFTVCMGSYGFSSKKFCFHEDFFYTISSRQLKFNNGTLNPVSSLWRMQKYIRKGYSISSQDMLNLLAVAAPRLQRIKTVKDLEAVLLTVSPVAYKDLIAYMRGLRDQNIQSTEQLLEILNAMPVIDNPKGGY